MADIKSHKRVNDILLGPLERPTLKWLATHMPSWMNPDIMTGIGVFGAILIFVSYWLANYDRNFLWLSSLGFVVNWFGDSLDGNLARVRKTERPKYGFFIDHTIDALTEVLIFLGIGISPYIRFDVAAMALIAYLLMSVMVYVRTCVVGEFRLSYGRLGPTELRAMMMIVNTILFFFGNPVLRLPFGAVAIFDLLVAVVAGLLFAIYINQIIRQGKELSRLGE